MQRILLSNCSAFALVDDADYPYLIQWRWRRNNKGYAVRTETINGKRVVINMHRAYPVKSQTKRALKFGDYPFTTDLTRSSGTEAIALAVRHS